MNRRFACVRAFAPALVALTGLAAVGHADTTVVNVLGHEFSINAPTDPNIQDAVIELGDTVRWNFTSPFHTVSAVTGSLEQFDSGLIFNLPHTFDHTFTHTGTFHYYCGIHGFDNADGTAGGMAGIITVVPAGPQCDTIDFNHDDLFPDTLDIDDFLSVFAGNPCSTGNCGDIDFNNDGLFPDTLDIDSFLSVFAGGACL